MHLGLDRRLRVLSDETRDDFQRSTRRNPTSTRAAFKIAILYGVDPVCWMCSNRMSNRRLENV